MTDENTISQASNIEDTSKIIRFILHEQAQCVLATQRDGNIYQHLMAYAFNENLTTIYFASFENTNKVKNILQNASVSMLWDNRTGNNADHTDGFALSAQGRAQFIESEQQPEIRDLLLKRNDSLSQLMSQKDTQIIAVIIKNYHLVLGYTKSSFYEP